MDKYLEGNQEYWAKGYDAENVESFVFRPYGRIFKFQFGLSGKNREKLLDFGCGEGAALQFFKSKGFDVYGVDISEKDIARCKTKMGDVADHFAVIDPAPKADDVFFGGGYDVIVAIQALYYYDDADLAMRVKTLHSMLKPGGIIYVTMMGTGHYMYGHAKPFKNGLSKVDFDMARLKVKDYYINFTHSEEQLVERFGLFERVHVGYYDAKYREDEGASFHYTFVGRKATGKG